MHEVLVIRVPGKHLYFYHKIKVTNSDKFENKTKEILFRIKQSIYTYFLNKYINKYNMKRNS